MQLEKRDFMMTAPVKPVTDAFARANVACRFVGGCVRDALLDRAFQDIDIATPATPEAVMELLTRAGVKVIPTGLTHGTVTAVSHGANIEITTLRRDVACDGRHAEVAFTDDWREDAQRRDFTMNALYADTDGNLTDFFGGLNDARAGIVRFIGDPARRIDEDALRILRFFRFTAHYAQGAPDTAGLAACTANSTRIDALSGERIQTEMFKLLIAARAGDMLAAMQETGVLAHVLPASIKPAQLPLLHQAETQHNVPHDAVRALALLVRSGDKPADEQIAWLQQRWKLSNAHYKRLGQIASPLTSQTWRDAATGKQALRKLGEPLFTDHALLACVLTGEDITAALDLARSFTPPVFPLGGDDLMAAGFAAGPDLGKLLARLEYYWEEHAYVPDKNALLELAKQLG